MLTTKEAERTERAESPAHEKVTLLLGDSVLGTVVPREYETVLGIFLVITT